MGTLEGTDEALVEDLMTRTIVGESGLILGEPVEGEPATGATIEVRKAEFIDGSLTAAAITTGVPEDATVTLVVWERPAEGAAWVQTPELFHAGGPLQGTEVTLATPRNCAPVEYRFDLYTNGVLVDSVTMPGVAATC